MTSPDKSKGNRSRDEVLAGEYVLGVLSLQDRRVVEERMRHDRTFAAIVSRWETNLSAFNDEYDGVAPSRETFKQIESRLFGDAGKPASFSQGLWNSAVFWRSLAFACIVVAVSAVIFASGVVPQPQGPTPLVADLSGQNNAIDLRASYEIQSGRLKIVPVAAGKPEEKSLELWLVQGGGTPKSLGVFQPGESGELVIPAEMRSNITDGATLAVSLEPFGGSPTGQATGPVVASGAVRRP
ncbi:anti-sigma factor [Rhizobium bangladeshense]|uniref:anti-sigma factor n=1 Tax=Rhizobium bangladeshense TaxID=1138189 RepID=UPI001A995319|nr:anti-sigma factor [Rhizobium bangladeshense]MBX4932748.1 anti-sigma factor [Rhizobium bangladeshense]MBY3580044.1 anti-sigma factor [Rhizobium bangladeshense]QSY88985.1 anti-sigma factor [Rhizobium bangladeshense]